MNLQYMVIKLVLAYSSPRLSGASTDSLQYIYS